MEAVFVAALIGAIGMAGLATLAAARRIVRPSPQPVRVPGRASSQVQGR